MREGGTGIWRDNENWTSEAFSSQIQPVGPQPEAWVSSGGLDALELLCLFKQLEA